MGNKFNLLSWIIHDNLDILLDQKLKLIPHFPIHRKCQWWIHASPYVREDISATLCVSWGFFYWNIYGENKIIYLHTKSNQKLIFKTYILRKWTKRFVPAYSGKSNWFSQQSSSNKNICSREHKWFARKLSLILQGKLQKRTTINTNVKCKKDYSFVTWTTSFANLIYFDCIWNSK